MVLMDDLNITCAGEYSDRNTDKKKRKLVRTNQYIKQVYKFSEFLFKNLVLRIQSTVFEKRWHWEPLYTPNVIVKAFRQINSGKNENVFISIKIFGYENQI